MQLEKENGKEVSIRQGLVKIEPYLRCLRSTAVRIAVRAAVGCAEGVFIVIARPRCEANFRRWHDTGANIGF
jgi:hypothetical protein